MIAVYAEKMDVAIRIAAALAGFSFHSKTITLTNVEKYKKQLSSELRKNGYIPFVYQNHPYCVTWGQGHMCQLKQASDYNPAYASWKALPIPFFPDRYEIKVRPQKDPKTGKQTRQPDPWTMRQLGIVKKLFDQADLIINATDDDREGELIFAYVYEILRTRTPYKRVRLDSQTQQGFVQAFANLVDASQARLVEQAGRCRSIADWITGANLTALMTLKYGKYLPALPMLSVGRIQTVVLDMIVEREKAIAAFEPQPFWQIQGRFINDEKDSYTGRHIRDRFFSREEAQAVFDDIQDQPGIVDSVEVKDVRREVPLLYNLPNLSREANRRFGFTAKQTLQIAQSLYEAGFITYPRTESQHLTGDMQPQADAALQMLHGYSREYKKWIDAVPRQEWQHSSRHYDSRKVESHFAIIPTSQPPKNLNPQQEKLYDLIARSLICTIYKPALEQKTTLITLVNGQPFKTTGVMLKDPQWMALIEKKKEDWIPPVVKGQRVFGEYELKKSSTEPPKRYTDASLLLAMQTASKAIDDEELKQVLLKTNKGGIGRPSTQGPIIEMVVSRFCRREGKQIVPSPEAMAFIDMLPVEDLKSPQLTARWESMLDEVAKGSRDMDGFIEEMEQAVVKWAQILQADTKVHSVLEPCDASARNQLPGAKREIFEDTSHMGVCPVCKSPLKHTSFGWCCSRYSSKENGCRFGIPYELAGGKLTDKDIQDLLETGRTGLITGFQRKDGTGSFDSYLVLEASGKVSFTRQTGQSCPHCGKPLVLTSAGIGCSGHPYGCQFFIASSIAGKKLSEKQKEALIVKKKTPVMKGFKSKNGRPFEAALEVNEHTGSVQFAFEEPQIRQDLVCPVCSSPIKTSSGKWCCSHEGCSFVLYSEIAGRKLGEKEKTDLVQKGRTQRLSGFVSKSGKPFEAALVWDAKESRIAFDFSKPSSSTHWRCPRCGQPLVKEDLHLRCSQSSCGFHLYTQPAGRKLSDQELEILFEKGQTPMLSGFKSKAGRPFDAALKLDADKGAVFMFLESHNNKKSG